MDFDYEYEADDSAPVTDLLPKLVRKNSKTNKAMDKM